jgi:starch-binding outer membrane protein, SusD/RagB family
MKKNKINQIIKYALLGSFIITIGACKKDIFDKKDLQGVDPDIWNLESATNLYINKTYDIVMPNWPVQSSMHNTTDESNGANTTLLYGQLTDNSVVDIASNNTNTTNNQYFTIRRINLAIEGIENGTMSDSVKAVLKGQMYFFRAYVYFNLVKLYGGVPLVLKSQDLAGDDELAVPRSKTSECFARIARDLDSCYGLPKSWSLSTDGGRITKGVAMALKGKALMYWASPQFNPNNDAARWEAAYQACKAAYDTCISHGYNLQSNFTTIFIDESTNNKERMMWRTYDNITINPGRGTNIENLARPVSQSTGGSGSYQPTWNLVKAFTMKDGQPITSGTSGYNAAQFWLNRDPRFDATVAYNGQVWALSGISGRRQWNYLNVADDNSNQSKTGFYCRKICNPNITAAAAVYNSNSGGGSGMDWIEMRFAEVLLNLAECANATNRTAEAQTLIIKLRTRAGIIAGSFNYGLALATNQAQLADLILNERQIEFAMEGKRYDDLRRTRMFHTLSGTVREGYRWTVKAPYTLGSGTDVTKIYLEMTNAQGFKPRDTANLNNPSVASAMFTTSQYSLDTSTPINFPTTYYFYPLPVNFRTSSVLIEQTIGWPGGSFDPLL